MGFKNLKKINNFRKESRFVFIRRNNVYGNYVFKMLNIYPKMSNEEDWKKSVMFQNKLPWVYTKPLTLCRIKRIHVYIINPLDWILDLEKMMIIPPIINPYLIEMPFKRIFIVLVTLLIQKKNMKI